MKKIISLILSAVIMLTATLSAGAVAQAAVQYDDKNTDVSTSTHKILNITGTEYYSAAFQALGNVNSLRASYGSDNLAMDKVLMEAAMLRARELTTYIDSEYRPNGERFDWMVESTDPEITYIMAFYQRPLDADKMVEQMTSTGDYSDYMILPELKSAGVGCFLDESGYYYFWVFAFSSDAAKTAVSAADYPSSRRSTVKIALRKDLTEYWDKNHKHTYNMTVNAKADASKKKDGKITKTCPVCGNVVVSAVSYPKTVTLSATSYNYDGKVKKPTVTVKDAKGNTISASNYTVSYSSGRKNVGTYTVKVTFKGNYTGSISKTFTIKPKTTSISSLTAQSKGMTVKWKKQATQTTGYEIQIATDSAFKKNVKTYTVNNNKTVSKKITKLSAKKKYYVRIRTYKTVSGKKIYSSWSGKKNITTKK